MGGCREATGARTKQKHLRNRHLSLVLEVEIVAVAPPARGRRPAALRPAVEPACRTQPGRSGLRVCRAFAVRRQGIGVAHATRAPRVPDRPRFCGPAAKIRRAARNLGDPGFGYAAFFRSGGQKSACRMRSGRPGSRVCRVFTVRRPRIDVPRAIRAIRVSRALNLPGYVGPQGVQVVQFTGGTRFWPRRSAKTRHIRDPVCPVCMRHAVSGAPDRQNPAQWWSGGVGGGRRQATGARIWKKHFRNVHLSLVLAVKVPAVVPPARGRRPAALRPTVESAYRTQSEPKEQRRSHTQRRNYGDRRS